MSTPLGIPRNRDAKKISLFFLTRRARVARVRTNVPRPGILLLGLGTAVQKENDSSEAGLLVLEAN